MARLFRNQPGSPEGKYLVKRRDGSIPQWPFFVLAASDPAAPAAIRKYATICSDMNMDPEYVRDLFALAEEFAAWREANGRGDPDAPRHRTDDPATVAEMARGNGA